MSGGKISQGLFRAAAAAVAGAAFASAIRIGVLTAYDVIAPVLVLTTVIFSKNAKRFSWSAVRLPLFSFLALVASAALSGFQAKDIADHLSKSIVLALAFSEMFLFSYTTQTAGLLQEGSVRKAFAVAGFLSALICISQGQFGMFALLASGEQVERWTRFTGLSEHPVEAGLVAAYTVFLSALLAVLARNWRERLVWLVILMTTIYSMKYSASFTGIFSAFLSLVVGLALAKAWKAMGVLAAGVLTMGPVLLTSEFWGGSFMFERIQDLVLDKSDYTTLQNRLSQWSDTVDLMTTKPLSFLLGFGYSERDLAALQDLDIHNAALAAYFHFGLLGLVSQLLLLAFFIKALSAAKGDTKAFLAGVLIIFAAGYLTGPAFFRRSVWLLPVLLSVSALRTSLRRRKPAPVGSEQMFSLVRSPNPHATG